MSKTFEKIKELVKRNEIKISAHGYDELAEDDIFTKDIIADIINGTVVEDYPNFQKGPCVLILEKDRDEEPIHAVWGIPKGESTPAVLITAYRPDVTLWTDNFNRRQKK